MLHSSCSNRFQFKHILIKQEMTLQTTKRPTYLAASLMPGLWCSDELPSPSETLRQPDHACCTTMASRLILAARIHPAVHKNVHKACRDFLEHALIVGLLKSPLFFYRFSSLFLFFLSSLQCSLSLFSRSLFSSLHLQAIINGISPGLQMLHQMDSTGLLLESIESGRLLFFRLNLEKGSQ
jgi:hypothetical protein